MKATKLFNGAKAIVAFLIISILASCSCKKIPDIKPDPIAFVKPVATINAASKITMTSVNISGTVEPGEVGTKIYIELREANTAWQSVYIFTTADTRTFNVTLDFPNLKPKTTYEFRITAENKATSGPEPSPIGTFTTCELADLDGNFYHTIKIGTQVFMLENWRCTKLNDGTPIPNVTDATAWTALVTAAYCNVNNDASTVSTYGRLYNWAAVNTGKLAPAGWHVPTYDDLVKLHVFLGINTAAVKVKEAGTSHWLSPNTGATNESGFTALPGGIRDKTTGLFMYGGQSGIFWTSTSINSQTAWSVVLDYMNTTFGEAGRYKEDGNSVRLIMD